MFTQQWSFLHASEIAVLNPWNTKCCHLHNYTKYSSAFHSNIEVGFSCWYLGFLVFLTVQAQRTSKPCTWSLPRLLFLLFYLFISFWLQKNFAHSTSIVLQKIILLLSMFPLISQRIWTCLTKAVMQLCSVCYFSWQCHTRVSAAWCCCHSWPLHPSWRAKDSGRFYL